MSAFDEIIGGGEAVAKEAEKVATSSTEKGILSRAGGFVGTAAKAAGGLALKLIPGAGVVSTAWSIVTSKAFGIVAVAAIAGSALLYAYHEGSSATAARDAAASAQAQYQAAEQQRVEAQALAAKDAKSIANISKKNAALAAKVKALSDAAHKKPGAARACLPPDVADGVRALRRQQ